MPSCGCPDVKLANGQIRSCTCQVSETGEILRPVLLEVCPIVAAIKRLVADVVRQSYLSTLPIDALALLRVRLVAAIVVPARVLHSLVLVALKKNTIGSILLLLPSKYLS
ncbi:hypothetical protein PSTT_14500 [Puccinia striiformis]|uniref:Uncharacterized protein n=1 Tax=Puccinia striiformis TaxID=27350 RepID=A0A2S4ULY8_9BASI|nr:hypothetical protein PSTT_14500 [Puccinia striiformis]